MANFGVKWTSQWLKQVIGAENLISDFCDFPIVKAENARVGAIFDASYLRNRFELRGK